ncbi:4-(cytidine 5'-diphospho)-2-C-methyl-D-erythritol kinase [Thermophilibacter immobilis]|uniref:4-diphosphocytidyl-2-C-methyl-D-erythritol kinase n=1 Tax=Thermophilibacter immobilis TaxID=2779519 RepID=A0A7S7M8D3_9ACTN|nr:4-diphosphocytidyl-2C-methyl-D-erythritol kinase [Thermophilibacter immobilis]QOY60523.1 4-diphosphocytidyl-2C-methyl-D-erythritol kinase [Thermophilibacter immobilis]
MARREVVTIPCKINLHLGIHGEKDARGYHRVDSVMVPVALFDTVVVEEAPSLCVAHEPALEVLSEKTTVWKATTLLAKELGVEPAVRISVTARIPERAGLGGSSADAGATLRALARLWGVNALDARVVGVARRVGADVAFFLQPVPSLYLGAGDVLEEAFPSFEAPIALVMPATNGISTQAAYDEFDRMGSEPMGYEDLCAALRASDMRGAAAHLYNNLAPAASSLCGEVARVQEWLHDQPGVRASQVTGSGSCSFALCENTEDAERIAHVAAEECGWRAWATMSVGSPGKIC